MAKIAGLRHTKGREQHLRKVWLYSKRTGVASWDVPIALGCNRTSKIQMLFLTTIRIHFTNKY
jgi:hypothetical protein